MLRLLNLFGPRPVLQFVEIGARIRKLTLGLFVGRAEFLVLEAYENLSLFHLVAFFHADPLQASRDFGVHVDGMVRNDVAGRRKHSAACVVASVSAVARTTSTSGTSEENAR